MKSFRTARPRRQYKKGRPWHHPHQKFWLVITFLEIEKCNKLLHDFLFTDWEKPRSITEHQCQGCIKSKVNLYSFEMDRSASFSVVRSLSLPRCSITTGPVVVRCEFSVCGSYWNQGISREPPLSVKWSYFVQSCSFWEQRLLKRR